MIEETSSDLHGVVVAAIAVTNVDQVLPIGCIDVEIRRSVCFVEPAPGALLTGIGASFGTREAIAPIDDAVGADVSGGVELFAGARGADADRIGEVRNACRAAIDLQIGVGVVGKSAAELRGSLEVHGSTIEVGTSRHEDVRVCHDVRVCRSESKVADGVGRRIDRDACVGGDGRPVVRDGGIAASRCGREFDDRVDRAVDVG